MDLLPQQPVPAASRKLVYQAKYLILRSIISLTDKQWNLSIDQPIVDQLPNEELRKRTLILLPNQEDRLDPLLEKVYETSLKNDNDDCGGFSTYPMRIGYLKILI